MSGRISPALPLPVNIAVLNVPDENNSHLLSSEIIIHSEEGGVNAVLRQEREVIGERSLIRQQQLEAKTQSVAQRCDAVLVLRKQLTLTKFQEHRETICLALKALLRDENVAVRAHAAVVLGQHRALSNEELSDLFEAVQNKEFFVGMRINAVLALKKQLELTKSPERIETICLILKTAPQDDGIEIKTHVAIALGQYKALSRAEISILLGAVQDKSSRVGERSKALQVLRWQLERTESSELIDAICLALKVALQGNNVKIKTYIAIILGRYNKTLSDTEIPILFEALQNEAVQNEKFTAAMRINAVWALRKQLQLTKSPERIKAICLALEARLRDDDVEFRTETAIALSLHKALSTEDMPILFWAVQDKDLHVEMRREAAWALENQLKFPQASSLTEAIYFALEAAP